MVPGGGIEPPTRGFSIRCSTPELPGHSLRRRRASKGHRRANECAPMTKLRAIGKREIARRLSLVPTNCPKRSLPGSPGGPVLHSHRRTTARDRDPCIVANRTAQKRARGACRRSGRVWRWSSLGQNLGLRRFERKPRIALHPHFSACPRGKLLDPFRLDLGFERRVNPQ